MRTTKIMTFSVPPAIEQLIIKHAGYEHRTISEFLREAVRRYIAMKQFEDLASKGNALTKQRKMKAKEVDDWVNQSRRKKTK